jgi:hypothetical protein
MPNLLAIDLGLKTGLALYGDHGRLRSYRSTNFGSVSRLKRAIPAVLDGFYEVSWLVGEGDRRLFEHWAREALKRGAEVRLVDAQRWRPRLLYQRERCTGRAAKKNADALARQVIEWSGAPRPTSLRHDAAEAILIGLWGVLEVGWLPELPTELRRGFG